MDEYTNLRGMSPSAAKEYIVGHIASLNSYKKDMTKLDEEIGLWKKRSDLAAAGGKPELEAGARAKVAELEAKRTGLAASAADLRSRIEEMKRQLPGLAARMRSIDPDYLLAELSLATDDIDGTKAEEKKTVAGLASLSADSELAALKAKMGMGPSSQPITAESKEASMSPRPEDVKQEPASASPQPEEVKQEATSASPPNAEAAADGESGSAHSD